MNPTTQIPFAALMPITSRPHVIFLPGAGGDGAFWHGVGQRLPGEWEKTYISWPGLGKQPHDPGVNGFADLTRIAETALNRPSIVVAQSMGGIVAIELALGHPDLVTHLVLVATSGGLDVSRFGAADWRADFLADFPGTARWILTESPNLLGSLADLDVPTLLLWGEDDRISPPAVGNFLHQRISGSTLKVLPDAAHDLVVRHPEVVRMAIEGKPPTRPPVPLIKSVQSCFFFGGTGNGETAPGAILGRTS